MDVKHTSDIVQIWDLHIASAPHSIRQISAIPLTNHLLDIQSPFSNLLYAIVSTDRSIGGVNWGSLEVSLNPAISVQAQPSATLLMQVMYCAVQGHTLVGAILLW